MSLENSGPFLTDPNSQEHRLPGQTATIGRAVECDIVIASKSISRENTRIRRDGRHWFVEDLGSTNGTYLDRQKVTHPTPVPVGVPIRIGKTVLELRR